MVGHQTVGKHLRRAAATGVREQAAVLRIVLVREERRLAPIAPLLLVGYPAPVRQLSKLSPELTIVSCRCLGE